MVDRNKGYLCLLFICFVCFGYAKNGFTQEIKKKYSEYDAHYGLNAQIYKGSKYIKEHQQDFGHPFLFQETSLVGSVISSQFKLDSVDLQYDIYKQFLVFIFYDQFGSKQQMVLNSGEIREFYLGNNNFVQNKNKNINVAYLHRLVNDSIKCYLTYRKDYKQISNNSKKGFGYTDELRKIYLNIDTNYFLISRKKQLLTNLPEHIQSEVKEYLVSTKFNFRNANTQQITDLFIFINSLLR